jgi:hypothetical protein
MKILMLVSAFLLPFFVGYGQHKAEKELSAEYEQGEGSVMLNDGTELIGHISFNNREGKLACEDVDNEVHYYNARNIMGFRFYDDSVSRERIFYTLDFEEGYGEGKRPVFFEILKDLKTFAVVSKIDPIAAKNHNTRRTLTSTFMFGNPINALLPLSTVTQTETVYILTTEGELKPYMKLIRKLIDRPLFDSETIKDRVLDKDILEAYFIEPGYSSMLTFAKQNQLEFENKEQFIKIIQHYQMVMSTD